MFGAWLDGVDAETVRRTANVLQTIKLASLSRAGVGGSRLFGALPSTTVYTSPDQSRVQIGAGFSVGSIRYYWSLSYSSSLGKYVLNRSTSRPS